MESLKNILDGFFYMRWLGFSLLLLVGIAVAMHTGNRFRKRVMRNLGGFVLGTLFLALVLALLFNAKGCDGEGKGNSSGGGGNSPHGGDAVNERERTVTMQLLPSSLVQIEWQAGKFVEQCKPNSVHEKLTLLTESLKEFNTGRRLVLQCAGNVPTTARLTVINRLQEDGFDVDETTMEK